MRKLNLIVVFNTGLDKALFCIRAKEPYKGLTINEELLDNSKFAGNYNIPHIIKQIKVYLKNSY